MRIRSVETIVSARQPNVCIVRLQSDSGVVGLGETFYGASAVEAYVHNEAAHTLFSLDDVSPEAAARALTTYVGYQGSGTETRGNSAIDIALWDLAARSAGVPLRQMLGGPSVDSIPIYNTCAGTSYVKDQSRQTSQNWGLPEGAEVGAMEDLWAFLNEPARLAKELVAAGIPGMKIWPFDLAAEASRGGPGADLKPGLRVLDEIRSAVGDDIDIYLELHSLWNLPGARRLFAAVEKYDLAWVEDPIRADCADGLRSLADSTGLPIAVGESIAGQRGFLPLLRDGVIDFAIVDLGWTGGITEGRRIASLAALHGVPIAPHDCTGPISLAAGVHFATSIPNGHVQEIARAFYYGWYNDFVTGLPEIADGRIRPSDGPGLGVELTQDLLRSDQTRIVRSEA